MKRSVILRLFRRQNLVISIRINTIWNFTMQDRTIIHKDMTFFIANQAQEFQHFRWKSNFLENGEMKLVLYTRLEYFSSV